MFSLLHFSRPNPRETRNWLVCILIDNIQEWALLNIRSPEAHDIELVGYKNLDVMKAISFTRKDIFQVPVPEVDDPISFLSDFGDWQCL